MLNVLSFREDSKYEGQLPSAVQDIIDTEVGYFKETVSITNRSKIPDTTQIPIENPVHWLKISDVISCFVDMEGSTKLSASTHEKSTAKSYRLFTQTAIKIFDEFGSPYIDVKGDGVFALFDFDKPYTALAAIVTFKTFVSEYFTPMVEEKTGQKIGGHFGIDQKTVLVRKLGLKRYQNRTDRQNEVWAGKPINMSAKLASLSTNNKIWVSDRYFRNLKDEKALYSCGCPSDKKIYLWTEESLVDDGRFDFNKAYSLSSNWCDKHGKSFCASLVNLDSSS